MLRSSLDIPPLLGCGQHLSAPHRLQIGQTTKLRYNVRNTIISLVVFICTGSFLISLCIFWCTEMDESCLLTLFQRIISSAVQILCTFCRYLQLCTPNVQLGIKHREGDAESCPTEENSDGEETQQLWPAIQPPLSSLRLTHLAQLIAQIRSTICLLHQNHIRCSQLHGRRDVASNIFNLC